MAYSSSLIPVADEEYSEAYQWYEEK